MDKTTARGRREGIIFPGTTAAANYDSILYATVDNNNHNSSWSSSLSVSCRGLVSSLIITLNEIRNNGEGMLPEKTLRWPRLVFHHRG